MNLVEGDPLCAPYAVRPEVSIAPPAGALSGVVTLHVKATPKREAGRIARVELFVDGLRVASAESAEADLA